MSKHIIGDPRKAGEAGAAGDTRPAGDTGPAGDPRKAGQAELEHPKPKRPAKSGNPDG